MATENDQSGSPWRGVRPVLIADIVPTKVAKVSVTRLLHTLQQPLASASFTCIRAAMLIGRKNLTFRATTGRLPHMVHTVFPQVLVLPPVYRSLAQHLLRVAVLAVVGMAGYCLIWFLGIAGVIEPDGMLLSHRVRFLLIAALTAVLASLLARTRRMPSGGGRCTACAVSPVCWRKRGRSRSRQRTGST